MSVRHNRVILIVVLLITVAYPSKRLFGQASSVPDMKNRVKTLWESCYHRPNNLRTRRVYSFYAAFGGKPEAITQKDTIEYDLGLPFKKFGYTSERFKDGSVSERFDELTITNTAYEAVLMHARKDKDAWVLKEFRNSPPSDFPPADIMGLSCPWLVCSNILMPDWLAEKTFNVLRVDALDGGPSRVHFSYSGEKNPPSGWIDIDLGRKGIILGYEFDLKTKVSEGKEIGQYEYKTINEEPVLRKRTITRPHMVSAKYGNSSSRETDEYETDFKAVSNDEFFLSFYGIPEPAGSIQPKRFPIYLWLLIGAFACLAVTIGVRNRARLRFWSRSP
jgi:hypothetical protein